MRRGRGRAKRGRRPQDMITRLGTSFWAGVGQRLGSSLEVPGLGRAGQMLQVLGWRFWEDLVRCWPNVFNLGAPKKVARAMRLFWCPTKGSKGYTGVPRAPPGAPLGPTGPARRRGVWPKGRPKKSHGPCDFSEDRRLFCVTLCFFVGLFNRFSRISGKV